MKECVYEVGICLVDVLLISVKKLYEMMELLEKIEEYCDGWDVYIVGVINVGKLMFIN